MALDEELERQVIYGRWPYYKSHVEQRVALILISYVVFFQVQE